MLFVTGRCQAKAKPKKAAEKESGVWAGLVRHDFGRVYMGYIWIFNDFHGFTLDGLTALQMVLSFLRRAWCIYIVFICVYSLMLFTVV